MTNPKYASAEAPVNDDGILVAEVLKNSNEVVRLALSTYRGHRLLNCRVWYRASDGTMRPSKSGFGLRLAMLPAFHEAIAKAIETARAEGAI